VLWTDGALPDEAFQTATADALQQLTPWGQQFPAPVFEGRFRLLDYRWLKDAHLKLRLALPAQGQVRLVYELDKNTFNGVTSLQLRVLHLEQ